ncbi:MAG: 50S ribosomal protein L3 [Patescibacteria group bacterium]|nr:50S ribosomal protein L3 [Patescibacteria group bacterium]
MKFVLGTKERMTQVFNEAGFVYPATILRVTPGIVSQVKTKDVDGYEAVQIASGMTKERNVSKAQRGHLGGAYRQVKEFRPRKAGESIEGVQKGATVDVGTFVVGDVVTVSAISKGKGFQGVVKRHGFRGDKASHGRKHSARTPGSIGGGGRAGGRVIKGMRMAGRMGGARITVKNLTVLAVDPAAQTLLISGAVPGRRGTLVEVRSHGMASQDLASSVASEAEQESRKVYGTGTVRGL